MASIVNKAGLMLNALSVHYGTWLDEQRLPQQCAMELLHEDISDKQRAWLSQFVIAWDAIVALMEIERR